MSTVFKEVSEETKRQVAGTDGSRLKQRDPSMHGTHHTCSKCDEVGKYIAKNTHWCEYHLDLEEYEYLAGMSREEYEAFKAKNKNKEEKVNIVNAKNLAIGFNV